MKGNKIINYSNTKKAKREIKNNKGNKQKISIENGKEK